MNLKLFQTSLSLFRIYSHRPVQIQKIYGFKRIFYGITGTSMRTLVTGSVLGLDGFLHRRKKYEFHFHEKEELFFQKMAETSENEKFHVYIEDLKTTIYLCKNNEKHLSILKSLLVKYFSDDYQRLTEYQFGPEVMRLFYVFNDPLTALELIRNDDMKKVFCQVTSFTIIMDNLFRNGYYEEILHLFHDMLNLKLTILPVPKEPAYVTLAACFKLNTEESLDEALSIFDKCVACKVHLGVMHYCFIAALSINRGKFSIALELLSRPSTSNHIYLNLKALAFARNGDPQMAEGILQELYEQRKVSSIKPVLLETITAIANAYKEIAKDISDSKFIKLKQALEESRLINYEDLDSVMCQDMEERRSLDKPSKYDPNDRNLRRDRLAASFSQNERRFRKR